ncbi:MAG: oligoendopeptidase F [Dehalococcoidia bacterium]|nr:oligoendopeptidase F [Dehalococcoidia bacterium]
MDKLPKRQEIPKEQTWDLESIYASDQDWENDFKKVESDIPGLEACQGNLGSSARTLLQCLQDRDKLLIVLDQVLTYAHMRRDEDNTNSIYQALADRSLTLATRAASAIAFFTPEILTIPEDRLKTFFDGEPGLQIYGHHVEEMRRQKEHVRSAEVEALLAQVGEVAHAPATIFRMLTNADFKFPSIKDVEGHEVELTHERYIQFLESQDRRVRKDAFAAMYGTFGKYRNTIASSLGGSIKGEVFYSRARNYASSLESALKPNNIPLDVYRNLVSTVNDNLSSLHRYMRLRKQIMGLDELHMYDLYVPMVPDVQKKVSFASAVDTVVEGLVPLGEDYLSILRGGIRSRWIDVCENEGKTSGAYSGGCFTTNPFILLNFQGSLQSVFTIAHELGHSLHSHYSRKTQPVVYADYTIFVAEVASTLNEALLNSHLIKGAEDNTLRKYLINHYLESFRTTFFRQTMFAEFELQAHDKAEAGVALTPDLLCSLYKELNDKYYGPGTVVDEEIALEWMRIPHFYRGFYVYQYATGMSAAIALAEGILNEGAPAVSRYLEFLKSGDSDYSINLLRRAGVDMATPAPVQSAINVFNGLLDQMESPDQDNRLVSRRPTTPTYSPEVKPNA